MHSCFHVWKWFLELIHILLAGRIFGEWQALFSLPPVSHDPGLEECKLPVMFRIWGQINWGPSETEGAAIRWEQTPLQAHIAELASWWCILSHHVKKEMKQRAFLKVGYKMRVKHIWEWIQWLHWILRKKHFYTIFSDSVYSRPQSQILFTRHPGQISILLDHCSEYADSSFCPI